MERCLRGHAQPMGWVFGEDCLQCDHEKAMNEAGQRYQDIHLPRPSYDELTDRLLSWVEANAAISDEERIAEERREWRWRNFPNGRAPAVHEITETSTGKIIRYTIPKHLLRNRDPDAPRRLRRKRR